MEYRAQRDGVIERVSPRVVGHGIIAIGGGRRAMEDRVDPAVGFDIFVKPNDVVAAGDVIAMVHAAGPAGVTTGVSVLDEAIAIGDDVVATLPLVSHRVTARGVERLS